MPFTEPQIKGLAGKLDGGRVKTRQSGGATLSYIEGWFAVSEANRLFGFDGWDRETIASTCIWEHRSTGRCSCSYVARVRIRVRAGETVVVRDGSGGGHGSGATPGEAHESALKEAETDATKRALATFGNRFGLALYDKEQAGVRRRQEEQPAEVSWPVLSSSGELLFSHVDPLKYCTAIRQAIEQAQTLTRGFHWPLLES
jgi:DNA recombination protein Rad52